MDVAHEEQVNEFAAAVREAEHGRVSVLFNNAGVALLGNFEEISMENFRWLMDVNFWGVIYGTAMFLADLEEGEACGDREYLELLGICGGDWAKRLLCQQICGSRIYGELAARARRIRTFT